MFGLGEHLDFGIGLCDFVFQLGPHFGGLSPLVWGGGEGQEEVLCAGLYFFLEIEFGFEVVDAEEELLRGRGVAKPQEF